MMGRICALSRGFLAGSQIVSGVTVQICNDDMNVRVSQLGEKEENCSLESCENDMP